MPANEGQASRANRPGARAIRGHGEAQHVSFLAEAVFLIRPFRPFIFLGDQIDQSWGGGKRVWYRGGPMKNKNQEVG